jgi:hypothetical protein
MRRRSDPPIRTIGPQTGKTLSEIPIDKDVRLPDDIQKTIARGKAAFQTLKQKARNKSLARPNTTFVTSVVDANVQNHRDSVLETKAQRSSGKRGQPPMLNRLRAGSIVVDRLMAEGVPRGTGRDSLMNKDFRDWQNDVAASSRDRAKSRRKQVGADATRSTLKQIKGLDP